MAKITNKIALQFLLKLFLIQSYEKLKLHKKLQERGYLELTKYVYRLDDFMRGEGRGGLGSPPLDQ